jgi:hypothetical protein
VTGRRRPPRSGRGKAGLRARITTPNGFEDIPELSHEEVERRVDVRGGGEPREPIQRPARRVPPQRRRERAIARDSVLLIGLAVVGFVAVSFLLPKGPLTGSATDPPATQAAAASVGGSTAAPVTLAVPSATPNIVVDPSLAPSPPRTAAPTAASSNPTLKPGQTPRPTPKPTPVVTPKPTPTPGSPTITVIVNVVNDDGGTAAPGSWRLSSFNMNPTSFPGSSSGTLVTVVAGAGYQIIDAPQDAESQSYTAVFSSHCSSVTGGKLQAGQHVSCTVTEFDQPVQVNVFTHVNGADSASAWDVSVTATGVTPSGTVAGSETGVTFTFNAHASFHVNQSGPSGYDPPSTSGTCSSSSGYVPGSHISCSFTFDATPPTPAPTAVWPLLPLAFPFALRRRWRSTRR